MEDRRRIIIAKKRGVGQGIQQVDEFYVDGYYGS